MFNINIDYIIEFLINYIFLSIPQSLIIILLILLLLKEYRYFKTEYFKQTLFDVLLIAAMQSGFFMNYLFYFTNLNLFLRLFCNTIILFIFINSFLKSTIKETIWKNHLGSYSHDNFIVSNLLNKKITENELRVENDKYIFITKNNVPKIRYKNKIGIYISSTLVIAILCSLEIFTVLFLQYVFNFNMYSLHYDILDGVLLAYPTIIILAFIVYIGYMSVNTKQVNVFDVWKNNKNFRNITYIQGLIISIFSALVYIYVINNNLLIKVSSNEALRIIVTLYTLFLLQLVIYIRNYSKIYNKEK